MSEDIKNLTSEVEWPENLPVEPSFETEENAPLSPEPENLLKTEHEDELETSKNIVEIEPQVSDVALFCIEEKMSSVALLEDQEVFASAQPKEELQEDIKMQEDPVRQKPEEIEPVDINQPGVKTKVEETLEIQDESFANSFMDIEDIPFVRRSRRLKSTHIETFPVKLEEASASATPIIVEEASINNTDLIFSQTSESFAQVIPNGIVQQEFVAKPPPDFPMKVDNHDIRMQRYETILQNIYSKKSDKKVCKVNKTMKCDCTITEEEIKNGEVGCQYNCINRILYIECGAKCRCGGKFYQILERYFN